MAYRVIALTVIHTCNTVVSVLCSADVVYRTFTSVARIALDPTVAKSSEGTRLFSRAFAIMRLAKITFSTQFRLALKIQVALYF